MHFSLSKTLWSIRNRQLNDNWLPIGLHEVYRLASNTIDYGLVCCLVSMRCTGVAAWWILKVISLMFRHYSYVSWIYTRSTAVHFGIPLRPVLKHGPRSLSSMQVNGYNKPICTNNLTIQWDYEYINTPPSRGIFINICLHMENIPWAHWIWPERWWTMPDQVEVRGNPDGGPKQFWRANRLSELGIGAKDQSNHLVAGSFRSFPQDSWSI